MSAQQEASMKALISALLFVTAVATGTACAQPFQPNEAGVTMGHWHLNSKDVEGNKKILVAMGGIPNKADERFQRVTFPGVVVNVNLGEERPPATGGTQGTVINHVGFTVPNVQEAVAKWKAAGVPVLPGGNNRTDQAYVETPDGLRIEILENKSQKYPIQHEHIHFRLLESAIPQSQAWYAKIFGAKIGKGGNDAPIADLPGAQLRFAKDSQAQLPTRGRVLDHVGFDISDLQGFIKKLEANGIKLDQPYTKSSVPGGGFVFITDPWGVSIELTERPNSVYLP
jgi:catechol 2,3-dioxygenase-like lactoylglutathione lyase family enzyme